MKNIMICACIALGLLLAGWESSENSSFSTEAAVDQQDRDSLQQILRI